MKEGPLSYDKTAQEHQAHAREASKREVRKEFLGTKVCPDGYHVIESSKPAAGQKHDQAKPQWDLLPWDAVEEVVDVLTFGAGKYAPDNWRHVEEWDRRYFAAALRHMVAWNRGEARDAESGCSHLAHAACCVLFLVAKELEP